MDDLAERITSCRACPRLVSWREAVAVKRRAAYATEEYWGRPVPGFGDPAARLVVVGLAPAAHGANRTGRMFTGDRSGDWLYRALHRAGYANRPRSENRSDGLALRDCWVTAAVRCAPPGNHPTPAERTACRPWLEAELARLEAIRVAVCLGALAWNTMHRLLGDAGHVLPRPRPRFAHGAISRPSGGTRKPPVLLAGFHPSQQNTFTGRLTEAMLDDLFVTARRLVGEVG
jgi:uracil-DNA glycosylase family 4